MRRAEWPTLALVAACYALWALGTTWASAFWLPLGIVLTALAIGLHSSLQHEIIHGHPFRNQTLNAALVFPAIGLLIPYLRFSDTHLAHHRDEALTDPYDDPESNYLDPAVWRGLPRILQVLLIFNNTLLGRLLIGVAVSQLAFMAGDARAAWAGDARVIKGWLLHIPAVALVVWWLAALAAMPVWAYLLAAYAGLALIKIRTFLEHQAHARAEGRTVIIEDRGPLAWLFLHNTLHVVHHTHPGVAWYDLPARYAAERETFLRSNDGYVYRSYAQIFRRHLLRTKDPVPHPFWR